MCSIFENLTNFYQNRFDAAVVMILGFLMIISSLLMIYFSIEVSLWNDEAITANAAVSLAETGKPEFESGYEYWRSLPYTLLVAFSAHIFGVTDFSLRLPSILIGLLTIVTTYIAGKEFFDKYVGIIGASLLALSAGQLAWATQVRMYVLLQFLFLLTALLIYRFSKNRNLFNGISLVIFIILTLFVHRTGQILVPIFLSYIIYYQRKLSLKKTTDNLKVIFASIFFGYILLELFSDISFLYTISRLEFTTGNLIFYYDLVYKEIYVLTILGIIGSLISFKEDKDSAVLMSICVFPASLIYLIAVDAVSFRHIYFSIPFLAIWSGLAIKIMALELTNFLNININNKYLIVILTLLSIVGGSGLELDQSNYRPVMDEKSAYEYIEHNSDGQEVLITQWTPSATYYYRPPDYSLHGDESFYHRNESKYNKSYSREEYDYYGVEKYSGAEFIDNTDKLIKIFESKDRGWLVLRNSSYERKPKEMQKAISKLSLKKEVTEITVWHWNESSY